MESLPKSILLESPEDAIYNIRKIYNLENLDRLNEAIDIIVEWIQKQDHIIKKDYSRDYLEKTLITSKGSVEKAKKQIDRLCTMKTLMPKFFLKPNSKTDLNISEMAWLLPLRKLTKDYQRIIIVRVNINTITPDFFMEYYRNSIMVAEYMKFYDYSNGYIIVYDAREVNLFEVASKINTLELHHFVTILIEGFGARLKCIHVITESKAIEIIIKIVKQFVSEKIGNRIKVHPTLEDLHKELPKELLPLEYGGNEASVNKIHDNWLDELFAEKHLKYLEVMNKATTDESRRHNAKFNEEYMGMPGSFRNLIVD